MSHALDCIAIREFPSDARSNEPPCVIKIYRPVERDDDGRSFGCYYELLTGDVVMASQTLVGIDSIQSLIGALTAAALELELTKKRSADWFVDDLMRIKA